MENSLTPTLNQPFGDIIELHQQVLSRLSPQTAERIAHQNLEELMGESAKGAPLPQIKSGTLQHDETWSGEIYIPDGVRVPQGVTLTIEPGTIIKFKYARDYRDLHRGTLMISGGTLKAIGTPTNPIWFTSNAENPINGDWEGILVENSNGENTFNYCIVEYAFIGIRFWTASGTVANSIVRWINAEGIYMERSHVVVENSMFYGTGYNGIAMEQFNDVTIRNNKIFNNQGAGIHGEATKAIVENNIVRNGKLGITFEDLSEVTLRNNLVENNRAEGIHLYFNSIGYLISNKVRYNGIGITSSDSRLTISNSDIYGNTRNLVLYTMQQVDVRHNWWGSTDNATIKGTIESDVDVAIEPYLNEETVSIPDPVYDYQDVKKTELGYIPGDPQDQYPYVYADTDETRRVVKKICGAAEGFGEYAFGWSLAWDGKYLWRSRHAGSGELIKIDPETCAIVADFGGVGVAQDRGMTFDGKSLWINDFTQKRVFEIEPKTGNLISSFKIPEMGSGSSGIAWDGEFLYLIDWLKRDQVGALLYKVDRQGNLIGTVQLEKEGGATITFDGQYFWMSPCRSGICKYNKQGKLVGEVYAAAFGGEAIAHDGRYLWVLHRTQELWSDPKLYKIEVVNDQILLG